MGFDTLGPRVLQGDLIRLEPLRESHNAALWKAAQQIDWKWFLGPLTSFDSIEQRIKRGITGEKSNQEFAFAVVSMADNEVIGSTAYLSVVQTHRRVEIGSTWYVPRHQGGVANPESKYLLLSHAFEDWGAVRVELRTDQNNLHSQRAILKLGAKLEGVMRNNGIRPDGTPRNAMLYSIIPGEWPSIKARLLERIESHRGRGLRG